MQRSDGNQTHASSLRRTLRPRSLRTALTLNGDTRIGLTGKKYRTLSNGARNATPSPPSVNASRNPCEAVARKRQSMIRSLIGGSAVLHQGIEAISATIAAKHNECVNPRCPKTLSYGTPSRSPIPSISGNIAHKAAVAVNARLPCCGVSICATATPTTAWLIIVGILKLTRSNK